MPETGTEFLLYPFAMNTQAISSVGKNVSISWIVFADKKIESRCQFHQHFMRKFYIRKSFRQLFYLHITREKLLKRRLYKKFSQKTLMKLNPACFSIFFGECIFAYFQNLTDKSVPSLTRAMILSLSNRKDLIRNKLRSLANEKIFWPLSKSYTTTSSWTYGLQGKSGLVGYIGFFFIFNITL